MLGAIWATSISIICDENAANLDFLLLTLATQTTIAFISVFSTCLLASLLGDINLAIPAHIFDADIGRILFYC